MRFVFMGTPAFAVAALDVLAANEFLPAAVVTRPDRPRGRGWSVMASPAKEWARARGVPVLQPTALRDAAFLEELAGFRPEVALTAAYGRILPPEVLGLPDRGCINLHASLLPRWRGAAPVQRAVMAGDEMTGATTFWMDAGMDTGDLILQAQLHIGPEETAGEILERLGTVGGDLLVQTLRRVVDGTAPRIPQEASGVSNAPPLGPEEEEIPWNWAARRIADLVRALAPAPGARTLRRGERLKVWRATALQEAAGGSPGTVVGVDREGIRVAAGQGIVLVREVQPAGGRRMNAADYARGHRLAVGEPLGG